MDRQSITIFKSKREQTESTLQTQSITEKRHIIQRSRTGRGSISFLHAVLIVLLCPYLIASVQDALFFGSGSDDIWAIQSSRSAAFFGGVHAMALPKSSQSFTRQQSVFDIERQQRTGEQSANVTRVNGTATSVDNDHSQSQQSVVVVDVPSKRWGHSVTYLKDANVALFVGGQVSSDNDSMVLTNDVFAMDLSANSTKTWVQLSSDNLPPHAFAGRAVTHDEEGSDERVFIVGGATDDCSSNSSQVSMWQAGSSWKDGQWSTPAFNQGAIVPERRRGARAIQVPVQMSMQGQDAQRAIKDGGISFMVLGGSSDETTCSNASSLSSDGGVWTMGAGAGEGRRSRNSSDASTFDTRALVLSSELTNISVAEYSAVVLPANGTKGDRLVLLGGVDKDGNLTSFEQLWVLDFTSGLWSRMQTTNSTGRDVPHGRIGHTSTRMEDGAIIVFGGYTSLDSDEVPTSDVHVLNYTVNPAVWSRVNSSQAPNRAFHTAFMAGQVMVVGFGQGEYNSSNSTTSLQSRDVSETSQAAVQFLDTSSANWTWADSMAAVLAARQVQPSPSSTPAVSSASTSTSASFSASSSTAVSMTPVPQSKTSAQKEEPSSSTVVDSPESTATVAPSPARTTAAQPSSYDEPTSKDSSSQTVSWGNSPSASSTASAQPTTTTDGTGSSGITPEKRNTAVIASVLGAAAIAASMAGLYAAHKRREARLNGDHYTMSGDKYEHFSSSAPGPPVSALWLHQLKRKATLASGAMMNRGKSLKRGSNSPLSGAASAGTSPRSFSTPANDTGFRVLRNLPPTSRLSMRRNQLMQQEATRDMLYMQENAQGDLPDHFLHSILSDDEEMRANYDTGRTLIVPPPAAYNTRALSSESLESDGGLSHFSYPYLSAVHRLSPTGSPSTNASSPRYAQSDKMGYSNFAMTPTWSPSPDTGFATEKRDSVNSFEGQCQFESNTKSPSAIMEAANCVSSPFFPREDNQSPMLPDQAYLESNDQRKSQQSTLRVMNNDAGY